MNWILAAFTILSFVSVCGMIVSNILLIKALTKRQMIEKADNLFELKEAETKDEIKPDIKGLVEIPAFDN